MPASGLACHQAAQAQRHVSRFSRLPHSRILPASTAALSEPLTPREVQVLRMIADGLGNKQIAWQLGISEHTVKFHVTSIMAKLHASSRTEAVAAGIRHGLVLV